jgi:hypothetical protein
MYLDRKEWREEVLDQCNALLSIIRKVGYKNSYFSHGSTALVGLGLFYKASRSHSDTSHSVGFLWMTDQPVGNTCT